MPAKSPATSSFLKTPLIFQNLFSRRPANPKNLRRSEEFFLSGPRKNGVCEDFFQPRKCVDIYLIIQ